MSTYAIAGAIELFAKNFKEIIREKNQIERERLEFEKEKFEFNKKQLSTLDNHNMTNLNGHCGCEVPCPHNWIFDCNIIDMEGTRERYHCSLCGEVKTVPISTFMYDN